MYDAGDTFFSYTTFARYENGNVGRGYLYSFFYGAVQHGVVADDAKSLFYSLDIFHFSVGIKIVVCKDTK